MRLKIIYLSFILLFFCTLISTAQTADDYFHGAANNYVKGQFKEAGQMVAEGIKKFPDDERFKALAEKLKKEEQEQEQQQNQEQNQDQQEQEQEGQQNQDQEGEQQDEQQQQQQEGDSQEEEGQEQEPQMAEGDENEEENMQEMEAAAAGEISREDAERMLRAIEQQDAELQEEMQEKKAKGRKTNVEKNW